MVYSEGQIGWIPFFFERADDAWEKHRGGTFAKDAMPEPPSGYYYRQSTAAFSRTTTVSIPRPGGVDNVTFETDYPHADSTWPDTRHWRGCLPSWMPRRLRKSSGEMQGSAWPV